MIETLDKIADRSRVDSRGPWWWGSRTAHERALEEMLNIEFHGECARCGGAVTTPPLDPCRVCFPALCDRCAELEWPVAHRSQLFRSRDVPRDEWESGSG